MKGLKKPDPGGLLRPATGTEIAVGRAFYLDLYGWLGIAPQGATVGWFNQPVDREISPPGSASKAGPFFLTGCCPIYFRTAVARMSPKEKLLRPGGAASYIFLNWFYQRLGTRTPVTLRSSVVTTLISVPAGTSTSPPLMKAPPARPIGPSTR